MNTPERHALRSLRLWWNATTSRCERAMVSLLIAIALVTILSTALVQTLVVALAIILLSCVALDHRLPWRRTPLDIPFLAFVAGRTLSILFSQYPERSLSALWIEFFFYGVFFLVTQTVRRREEDAAQVVMAGMIAAGVVGAMFGIVETVLHLESRATSLTAGAYTLGAYLALVLPLALFFPLLPQPPRSRQLFWLVPLIFCTGIILTFDRLHWAAMGVILVVAAFKSKRRLPIVATAAVMMGMLAIPSVWGRFAQVFTLTENMNGRDVLWRGAAMIGGVHPMVGFGPRSFPYIFPLYMEMPVRGVGSWHNDYLQVYMESGLLGLLPLLWLIIATFVHTARWLRAGSGAPLRRSMVLALLGSVSTMFLIGGILDTIVGISFRILLALLALLIAQPGSPEDIQHRV